MLRRIRLLVFEAPANRGLFACLATGAVGCALVLASFYPGYMSNDSLEQLSMARSGRLVSWHPPVMTLLWGQIDRVWPGPAGLVLLHNLWFWCAAALLSSAAFRRTPFAVLSTAAFGLLPPVFALLGTAWKDVGFGCALFLGLALLSRAERTGSRRALAAAVPFLFYAFSVRHDGMLAVIPLCAFAGILFVGSPGRGLPVTAPVALRGAAAGAALFAGILLADTAIVRLSVGGKRSYPDQIVLVYDLAYLSTMEHEWLFPPHILGKERFAELSTLFDKYDCASRYCFPILDFFPQTDDARVIAELRSQWRRVVSERFRSFVAMKLRLARFDYSFGTEGVAYPFHSGVDANSLGVSLYESALHGRVRELLTGVSTSFLFRAWFWVLALVALVAVSGLLGPSRNVGPLLLGLGALAKDSIYFLWWPGYDFRYHWWTVLSVLALPLLILASRREGRTRG